MYCLFTISCVLVTGPSIILSFLIAFVVTLLNGLCFAEYASKNPKTGAQYIYMYETVGEAMAFIVGWTSLIGKAFISLKKFGLNNSERVFLLKTRFKDDLNRNTQHTFYRLKHYICKHKFPHQQGGNLVVTNSLKSNEDQK